jgi:hypothetical protein
MTTIQKTKIQPVWDVNKVRESAALVAVTNVTTALTEIAKNGPEAIKRYAEAWTTNGKINSLKKANVKNPLELVKHLAEFESNVFGSVLEIWGDENSATYSYISCGCFDACQANGIMKPENGEVIESFFKHSHEFLEKEFGYKVEVKRETKDSFPVITFTK